MASSDSKYIKFKGRGNITPLRPYLSCSPKLKHIDVVKDVAVVNIIDIVDIYFQPDENAEEILLLRHTRK